MSERVASAYRDEPEAIQAFLEEQCPAGKGLWLWEGDHLDDDADGTWRRPTPAEIETLHAEETAA